MCIISKFRPLTLQLLSDDKSAVYLLKTLNCAECLSGAKQRSAVGVCTSVAHMAVLLRLFRCVLTVGHM